MAPSAGRVAAFAFDELGHGAHAVEELRGEDDRRVPFDGDLAEHLEVAELRRDRVVEHHVGRFCQLAGAERLAFCGDDLRPLLPLGFGFSRHRPLHGLGELDVFEFHELDQDSPAFT